MNTEQDKTKNGSAFQISFALAAVMITLIISVTTVGRTSAAEASNYIPAEAAANLPAQDSYPTVIDLNGTFANIAGLGALAAKAR